ncbi:MAG: hypothetical protein K8S54_20120 [Spirochaetia bacterium]|nr:hypothetical protein [Spirochaetia bacterium]
MKNSWFLMVIALACSAFSCSKSKDASSLSPFLAMMRTGSNVSGNESSAAAPPHLAPPWEENQNDDHPAQTTRTPLCVGPSVSYRILFSGWAPDLEHYAIYSMESDGTTIQALSDELHFDTTPNLTNGRLLFARFGPENSPLKWNSNIYSALANGSELTQLTNRDIRLGSPSVLGNGRIVYHELSANSISSIHSMASDGTSPTPIIMGTLQTGAFQPRVSPDGNRIAYIHYGIEENKSTNEVYIMQSTGANKTRLTFSTENVLNFAPVWSLDGERILFTRSTGDSIESVIYSMNVNGSNLRKMTDGFVDSGPAFTPDGKIIFASSRDPDHIQGNHGSIFRMDSDGSNVCRLTDQTLPGVGELFVVPE